VGALMCVSSRCVAPLALGVSCTSTTECGMEASCVSGVCKQDSLVPVGTSCGTNSDGSYNQCAGLGTCSSGRCVLPPSVGQTCSSSGVACTDSAHCTSSVCVAFNPGLCPATASPGGSGGTGGGGSSGSSCVLSSCSRTGFSYSCGSGSYSSSTSYSYSPSGTLLGSTTTVKYSNGNTVSCQTSGSSGSCSGSGSASCSF
jgi:hypothetical protein